jgi:glycosyltransferase involved in cell wall biosynthesis
LLLAALELLKKKKCSFRCMIVGQGPLQQALQEEAHRRSLDDVVMFSGSVGSLSQHFQAAKIFVNTSSREGLGLASMEALMAGLPVVATHVGGVPEWLMPSGGGWLVPPDEPHILAEALAGALELPEKKRREIAQTGAKYLCENFSVEKYRVQLAELALECALSQ